MSNDRPIYLLDTNICIMYLKGRSPNLCHRLESLSSQEIAVCSVVKAELFYGSKRSNNPEKALREQILFLEQFVSLPFDDSAANFYAEVRATLAKAGTPIGANDLQIAAIALTHDLILVSHNVREFSRVPGLRLEDWQAE